MRIIARAIGAAMLAAALASAAAAEEGDSQRAFRFDFLSKNGNSSCAWEFQESIASMAEEGRLRGSCCGPMDLHRYGEQVEGLKKYAEVADIPPDPYDVPAPLAQRLLAAYDLELNEAEQQAYDYAMENSNEGGPCCCQCWRWHVYGGLAKLLIRERGFTGEQIAEVWDLSDGCGGAEHLH